METTRCSKTQLLIIFLFTQLLATAFTQEEKFVNNGFQGADHHTEMRLFFVDDLEIATADYRNRISPDPIFLIAEASSVGGIHPYQELLEPVKYSYSCPGRFLVFAPPLFCRIVLVTVQNCCGHLQLQNLEFAVNPAKQGNLTRPENLVVLKFQELLAQKKYKEAAELAAGSPQGILRTPDTIAKLQSVHAQSGQTPPLLHYFETLNAFESLELSRLVVNQFKKNLLESLLAENKLECSEELGDLVKTLYNDLALEIYIKARADSKVVAAFAERREIDKISSYSKQGAVKLAIMMSKMEGGCPVDYNTITNLFLQRNLIREATAFLLDVLKPNLPEHGFLQTKVLEINLVTFPNVSDAILANGMFSHYDRPQLCEKAGLSLQALQHYTDLPDVQLPRLLANQPLDVRSESDLAAT